MGGRCQRTYPGPVSLPHLGIDWLQEHLLSRSIRRTSDKMRIRLIATISHFLWPSRLQCVREREGNEPTHCGVVCRIIRLSKRGRREKRWPLIENIVDDDLRLQPIQPSALAGNCMTEREVSGNHR